MSGAPAPSAAAADCEADGKVQSGAIFNQPHWENNGGDEKIHRHIICLVDGAPGGSEIRVASYHFAHKGIKDALLRAHEREVDIKVMIDRGVNDTGTPDNPIYFDLQHALHSNRFADSWIDICDGPDRACIGNKKMHNKILLFSETHGVNDVSFITSSNLQDNDVASNSGTDMWNSGYTATDENLYGHLHRYFTDLSGVDGNVQNDPENLNYYADAKLPDNYGKFTVYHSPRKSPGNTALDVLSMVDCDNKGSGGTNPGNRTIVRVSMWSISGDEDSDPGTLIAKKLADLDKQGCYVDIVADQISADVHGPLRALLANPEPSGGGTNYHGPEVREFNSNQPHGVHEKNVMIDGRFDGKNDQKVTFTGSYNFTYRSVRVNDETWLRIDDPTVHDSFRDNFLDVRDAAHTCWQTSKPEGCGAGRVIPPDQSGALNCHETADKYLGAGDLYLYTYDKCKGGHDAKDDSGADKDYGDGEGQIESFDNKANSIVNTTGKTIKFYNYPNYNEGHPEGGSFCLRPDQWINNLGVYGDNDGSWQNSISSHRLVDDPAETCDRWFGGYHEPNRPRVG